MSNKRKYEWPFISAVPPLFLPGGPLHKIKDLGTKLSCASISESLVIQRDWTKHYEQACREMAYVAFLEDRFVTKAERSQLLWVREGGHYPWFADRSRYLTPNTELQYDRLRKHYQEALCDLIILFIGNMVHIHKSLYQNLLATAEVALANEPELYVQEKGHKDAEEQEHQKTV